MNQVYVIRSKEILERAIQFARNNWEAMSRTKHPLCIEFKPESQKRSSKINSLMWVVLKQMETKCVWADRKLSDKNWKNLITAGMDKLDVVPNVDYTGFVALGKETHNMTDEQIRFVIETACAIACQQGVRIVLLEDAEPYGRTA